MAGALEGLRVAIDVQHLYRPNHPRDRGAVYRLPQGPITEAHCSTLYAGGIHAFLVSQGASVLVNDPGAGVMVGYYSRRARDARSWGAHIFLACHINAGRGSYARFEMMSAHADDSLCHWIGHELERVAPEISTASIVHLAPGERGAVCIENFPGRAVILEPFFGDNPAHWPLCRSDRLVALGQAIGRGLGGWWATRHPFPPPAVA